MKSFMFFLVGALLGQYSWGANEEASPFYWGAASAAFQVEGNPEASDWKTWTQTHGKIKDGTRADFATDFWNRFDEDFKISKDLGLNSYRLSIAWERIFPEKDKFSESALKKYGQIILKMREQGLEPLVTLHHFVLPEWLAKSGGVLSPDFVSGFENYTRKVVSFLSADPYRVKYWITINEPNVLVRGGYLEGDWPPGLKGSMKKAVEATAQLIRAHSAAFNVIKKINPSAQVSISHHWRKFESYRSWNPLDYVAQKLTDNVWNDQIMQALMSGEMSLWMPGGGKISEKLNLVQKPALDFLGINYYGRTLMAFSFHSPFVVVREGKGPKNDLGWEIYPQGLEDILEDTYSRYKLPLMITENGLADAKDEKRSSFLKDHIAAMKRAQSKGIPVLGYYHWSLTDNFEWALGLEPRFGLVDIDYTSNARRTLRPSAQVYKEIVEASKK